MARTSGPAASSETGPGAAANPHSATSRRPRWSERLVNVVLTLGAIGGVLCIIGVILAWAFGINLIMFKTGSMSPTISTGSVAVVREIPASEIKVGDVVTVDRANLLPVTHRVREIAQGPGDTRIIVLRGDANASDDPAPYTVDKVRRVIYSIPGLAKVIVWFGNPFVLGGITIGAAVLVLWAFWPRTRRDDPHQDTPLADATDADAWDADVLGAEAAGAGAPESTAPERVSGAAACQEPTGPVEAGSSS